ncbi:MAG: OmpH family outer membrane protein [Bacteroidales bacterium]|nr:OmpH family outer membrane protein [Bacteroidales bacterium]
MKRIVLSLLLIAFVLPAVSFAQSQDLKFGHLNVSELMSMMPERDSIRQEMQEYQKMLQKEMQTMRQEYSQKFQEYQKNRQNYSEMVRKSKEKELQQMQGRIQEFQSTAQQDMQQKQQELMKPLMNRIDNAIQRVGKQHGYIYIFDTSAGAIVYQSEQSENVMPLVQEELGLQ